MLTGKVNENIKKNNNNRSNQQKSNLARAVRLFCTFLCRCFARPQHETSRNFLVYTFYGGNVGRVLVHFFSLSLIFTLVAATKFHFVPPTKVSPFVFSLSLQLLFTLSFSGLSPTFSFSLSFSFSIFEITLGNTDTETFAAFRFRLY